MSFRGGGMDRMRGLGSDLQEIDWSKIDVPQPVFPPCPLTKETLDRPADETDQWRKDAGIAIVESDGACPPPVTTFKECESFLPPFVMNSFTKQGFKAPTAIQSQSWSLCLQNRDMVGIAKTGSGKTLAFTVPGIMHILAQQPIRRYDGPIMCVLAPTRELAKQIEDEILKLTQGTQVKTVCAYGGTSKFPQKRALNDGVHIMIGCPGRIIDLLSERATNMHRVSFLVLDEADRMLDMGFEPQIRMICSQLRPQRQTLMFSATWPKEVQGLAQSFQRNYVRINVGSMELRANADVRQHIMVLQEHEKLNALMKIVQNEGLKKIIIFAGTKRDADDLCDRLRRTSVFALSIHGDKTQQARDYALEQFRRATRGCLVATDVAQRGLDIRDLDAVVNYEFPMMMEDYVHRVGRTGRAGAKGDAFSFINEKHGRLVPELIDVLKKNNEVIPEELHGLMRRGGGRGPVRRWGGGGGGGFGGGGFGGGGWRPPMGAGGPPPMRPPPPAYHQQSYMPPPPPTQAPPAAPTGYYPPPPAPRPYQGDSSYRKRERSPPGAASTGYRRYSRSRSRSPRRRSPPRRRYDRSRSRSPRRYSPRRDRSYSPRRHSPRRRSRSPYRR